MGILDIYFLCSASVDVACMKDDVLEIKKNKHYSRAKSLLKDRNMEDAKTKQKPTPKLQGIWLDVTKKAATK